jgi:glycosyltransferase involved in cell wall biosynthesis
MATKAGLVRAAYRAAMQASVRAALPFRPRDGRIRVFYGGARGGRGGGPRVKVRLLQQRFPERRVGFSLVYILSNAVYLSRGAIDAIRRAGIPVVLNQNGVYYRAWHPQAWERENARMAGVHEAADYVFYQSEFCRRSAERFLGRRGGHSEILYNAVDTARFAPAPDRKRDSPFTILIAGKMAASMGYSLMAAIEGIAAARAGGLDVRLHMAGGIDPAVAGAANALIARRDLTDAVVFSGPYAHTAAPAIYAAADAYLAIRHNDASPNSVLEALSCGLPVLHSTSGGAIELVGSKAGVALSVPETYDAMPTPSPAAMADGIARVMSEHDAMSAAARARALSRFRIEDWLARHEALFGALVEEAGRA